MTTEAGTGDDGAAEARPDRGPRGERGEGRRDGRGDGRGEGRGEGRRDRGERRGERGPRDGQPGAEVAEGDVLAAAGTSVGMVTETPDGLPPAANAVMESHTHQDAPREGVNGAASGWRGPARPPLARPLRPRPP
jgi:hypothetical protein